ncbi:TetR-like C-terminal domain-containing protein [Streptomyces sp. NPDC004976]
MVRAGRSPKRLTPAGAELASKASFNQVTLSALPRRSDVKPASLYAHVRNSHGLKTRNALFALEELTDRVADRVAGHTGKGALTAFANAHRDYARTHPGRYEATRYRLDPQTAAANASIRHAQITRAIPHDYEPAEPDQTHAVRMLGSIFHGYASLKAAGGFDHTDIAARQS